MKPLRQVFEIRVVSREPRGWRSIPGSAERSTLGAPTATAWATCSPTSPSSLPLSTTIAAGSTKVAGAPGVNTFSRARRSCSWACRPCRARRSCFRAYRPCRRCRSCRPCALPPTPILSPLRLAADTNHATFAPCRLAAAAGHTALGFPRRHAPLRNPNLRFPTSRWRTPSQAMPLGRILCTCTMTREGPALLTWPPSTHARHGVNRPCGAYLSQPTDRVTALAISPG